MLQFFISLGSPTQLAVSPLSATAHVLAVRTKKPATVAAVPATASVLAPTSAASINQVTTNPVAAHAFVEVPSRRVHSTRTAAVGAHANLFVQHLHNATHASRIAAHGKMQTVAYAGPVFPGAKLGFLTVHSTRSATRFTIVPTRQGTLTAQ